MSTNKLIGIFIYAVTAFLLGWVMYGMVLMDFMRQNTTQYAGLEKNPPDMIMLFIANMAWGFVAAMYLEAKNLKDFMSGFKGSLPFVFAIMAGIDLGYMSFMNLYSWTWIAVDMVAGSVMWSLCNGVLAWWLGRGAQKA